MELGQLALVNTKQLAPVVVGGDVVDRAAHRDAAVAGLHRIGEVVRVLRQPGERTVMLDAFGQQSRGLRKTHETSRGWQASASKTVSAPLNELFAAWDIPKLRKQWLGGHEFTIRKKTAHKSMRITWADGTDVEVNFYSKGPGKSQVTIQHGKLKNEAAVARMKKLWRTAVSKLQQSLESQAI